MRRDTSKRLQIDLDDDLLPGDSYFTYRPLSNLPTPPPSSRESTLSQLSSCDALEQDESLQPKYRGKLSQGARNSLNRKLTVLPRSRNPPRQPHPFLRLTNHRFRTPCAGHSRSRKPAHRNYRFGGVRARQLGCQVRSALAALVPFAIRLSLALEQQATHAPSDAISATTTALCAAAHRLCPTRDHHPLRPGHCSQIQPGHAGEHELLHVVLGQGYLVERTIERHGAMYHGEPKLPHHAAVRGCVHHRRHGRHATCRTGDGQLLWRDKTAKPAGERA